MRSDNYRPDIQGLRAIAVLVVMLFHFNPAIAPGGFVGVDVFLVISGYLITSILLDKKAQPDYQLGSTLRYFYVSRIRRIAPAYFAMLILVSMLAAVLFLPEDLATYTKSLNQAAWFNSNHYFAGFGDYFAPANHEQPLLHTWSLAVEMQFYLLVPFLVLLLPVRVLKWLLPILMIGLSAVAEYRLRVLGIQQSTYYSLHARLPAFFAGALVVLVMRSAPGWGCKPWFGNLGLALVLASAAVQPLLGPFPGLAALLPVVGAALVLQRPAQGMAGQLLAIKPMVWLGQLSYSFYLWHWPVLALLRYYTGTQVLDTTFSLLFITLTLFLATLSYYWVETPLRVHQTRMKQTLAYGLLAGAIFATTPSIAKINQALSPAPLPVEYLRYADPTTICHGQIVGDCIKGDLGSSKEVLVLGDSHAAMLNLFFDQLGKELGFKARIITASSCVTIPGFEYQRLPEWAQKPCLAQIEQAQKYLSKVEVIFIAGMWSWQLQSNQFRNTLEVFLNNGAPQAHKYLVSQVPLFNQNPMRNHRFNALGMTNVASVQEEYKFANQTVKLISESGVQIRYLPLDNLAVFKSAPIFQDKLIYYDQSHMNEVGIINYVTEASELIKDAVNNNQNLVRLN
jgi:peptidoglycan/LPS O-acetylase OafA/YrhL